jgi:hypothetical protein
LSPAFLKKICEDSLNIRSFSLNLPLGLVLVLGFRGWVFLRFLKFTFKLCRSLPLLKSKDAVSFCKILKIEENRITL